MYQKRFGKFPERFWQMEENKDFQPEIGAEN